MVLDLVADFLLGALGLAADFPLEALGLAADFPFVVLDLVADFQLGAVGLAADFLLKILAVAVGFQVTVCTLVHLLGRVCPLLADLHLHQVLHVLHALLSIGGSNKQQTRGQVQSEQ